MHLFIILYRFFLPEIGGNTFYYLMFTQVNIIHPEPGGGGDVLMLSTKCSLWKENLFILFHSMYSGHHLIEFLMEKWGLKCVKLLDGFLFMPSCKASGLSGNIQLAEIVLKSKPAESTNTWHEQEQHSTNTKKTFMAQLIG